MRPSVPRGQHPAWSIGHSAPAGGSPCASLGGCHHGDVRALRLGGAVACLLAGSLLLSAWTATGAPARSVVVLKLSGVVDPFEASYIQGGIRDAAAQDADAVVLTIDTPGGLDSSMRTITQAILNSSVPVITYVSPQGARAASAGTFILLSGAVAGMAPGTNVCAAHP